MARDSRKAQFATEFMMTYGWALIGITAIFAVLYASGIIDVQGILPEKCALTPGFTCRDYLLGSSNVTIQVTNGIGKKIVIDKMQATHLVQGTCSGTPIGTLTIGNGATEQLTLPCPLNLQRGKERLTLNFTYYFDGDPAFKFSARGTLFARVS